MSNNIYGIDFGTCNFKVFSKSSGKVVSEKNTIAIINKTQKQKRSHKRLSSMELIVRFSNHKGST